MCRAATVALLVFTSGVFAACSKEQQQTCGPITIEQLDPDEGHLIAGATPPTYLTDPPTSGPHTPGAIVSGLLPRTISRVEQVSTLETGAVIVQYRDPRNRGRLERLAADDVVVAPNPDLPHEVVATGWLRKRVCSNVDVKALSEFIGAVRGRYATHITTTTRAGD